MGENLLAEVEALLWRQSHPVIPVVPRYTFASFRNVEKTVVDQFYDEGVIIGTVVIIDCSSIGDLGMKELEISSLSDLQYLSKVVVFSLMYVGLYKSAKNLVPVRSISRPADITYYCKYKI